VMKLQLKPCQQATMGAHMGVQMRAVAYWIVVISGFANVNQGSPDLTVRFQMNKTARTV
jgi:hypothetical protein